MPEKNFLNRREALKVAALTALSLPLIGVPSVTAAETNSPAKTSVKKASRASALKLGVASYSLAKLPVEGVIAVLKELEITGVSLYKSHAPWADGTPEQCRAVVQKFSDAGITVTSTGMIELPNDEAVVRKALDNVRAGGLTTFCGWLKQTDSLPLVDKLVKEYDLKVAIHNHGPTEELATGMDVWKVVQPYDRRIGLCLDVAHGFRAGENPAETIRLCSERLYEVHLRDTMVTGGAMKDPQPAVVGHGLLDFRSIIAALLEVKYPCQAEFEYEKKEDNRVPGLAESVGYVRGMLAGMAA
jgi:sugar phosphate isomerase/epimerase